MKLENLVNYVNEGYKGGLTKIEPCIEVNIDDDEFYIVKTKETYIFGSEEEADALINNMRQDAGFIGCDKKFKAGKVNKSGETVKPDTWTVVVKINR